MNYLYKYVLFFVVLTTGACTKKYPSLPKPREFSAYTKGVKIILHDAKGKIIKEGELIAITPNAAFLLADSVQKVDAANIFKAELQIARTNNNPQPIANWAILLPISNLLHGFLLIFTLPLNLAVTVPTTINANNGFYQINYPEKIKWEEIGKFARFPQGLPPNLSLSQIK